MKSVWSKHVSEKIAGKRVSIRRFQEIDVITEDKLLMGKLGAKKYLLKKKGDQKVHVVSKGYHSIKKDGQEYIGKIGAREELISLHEKPTKIDTSSLVKKKLRERRSDLREDDREKLLWRIHKELDNDRGSQELSKSELKTILKRVEGSK